MRTKTLPQWGITPKLISYEEVLSRVGMGVTDWTARPAPDPKASFEEFARGPLEDLTKRTIGNELHLQVAYMNIFRVDCVVREMGERIEKERLPVRERSNYAAVNLLLASGLVHAALLAHMRRNWNQAAVLVLCRTALEVAVRAGAIAYGRGNEPRRWYEGQSLPSQKLRRKAELSASRCCKTVGRRTKIAEPRAAAPLRVYRWLCGYTHLDAPTILRGPSHEASYAGLAYVSWLSAFVGQTVTGLPGLAEWPTVWPTPLPWLGR